jgi:hypothetical protein
VLAVQHEAPGRDLPGPVADLLPIGRLRIFAHLDRGWRAADQDANRQV